MYGPWCGWMGGKGGLRVGKIEVGDLVVYNPSGSLRFRVPDDDEEFHTGIVVGKSTCPTYRRINYDVMWDDCIEIYGYYGDELKIVRKAGCPR